jgi:holin|nr:MAG TPA: holin [Caudoviricetes sp.]
MNKHEVMSYLGAIVTVLGGLTLNDWGVIMGIIFGLFTIVMNWYYKQKDYELRKQALENERLNKEHQNEQTH